LVVLTGATNSAKSEIARGLIQLYLAERPRGAGERRPHLVTFEDPIESFFISPRGPKDLELPKVPSRALRNIIGVGKVEEQQRRLCGNLHAMPKTLLAQWHGIDYTPREKGSDVRDLNQAFADALRQTPTVFFIGEVRDPRDWVEILEFAGTGHLVITTAHAGSSLEAMIKILSSVGALTSADRRRYAARLRAVVHLEPRLADRNAGPAEVAGRNLLLPAIWRNTDRGLAALAANGFGAVVPECPDPRVEPGVSSLGRRWFANRLLRQVSAGALRAAWGLDAAEAKSVCAAIRSLAASLDLRGG
jgi:hypothetical protein